MLAMEKISNEDNAKKIRERNEQLIRRYFKEIIDGRSISSLEEIFHPECRIIRADRTKPLIGLNALRRFVRLSISAVPSVKTTLNSVICNDRNEVAVHVSHTARFGHLLMTPVGFCRAKDKSATWQAMALFKIKDDKIIEEMVIRDELSILKQIGMLKHGDRWQSLQFLRNIFRRKSSPAER